MRYAIILAAAFVGLFRCVGHAKAETTTEKALRALCGPRAVRFAPYVDEAGRRYLTHPVLIVAVMRKESHCRPNVIGRHGDTGLTQVRGRARNGLSRKELLDPRTNILTGARWLSMMTTWCGSTALGLGAYNSGKCDRSRRYARSVLAFVAMAWSELRKQKEPTS